MIARVTIYDDNGSPKGAYELSPSRTYENGISTKYVFEFEYNQLNYDKYKAERIEVIDKIRAEIDSHCSDNRDRNDGLYIAMKIIDRHIKEIEG